MALAGGFFTFINGRLNEAKTSDARERVIAWSMAGLTLVLVVAGVIATLFNLALWASTLYLVAFTIQIILFIRQSGPVSRIELVSFCLLCCVTVTTVSLMFTLSILERHLKVTEGIVDVLRKMNRP